MSKIIELSDLLSNIMNMYKEFIVIIEEERLFIINTKVDKYSEILSRKVSIARKIEHCDQMIEDTIQTIKIDFNIKEFSLKNIEDLSDSVNSDEREALFKISEIKGELKTVLAKVTKENKFNEELLLDHIEFANNILKIFESNSTSYSKTGINSNRSNNDGGFIDRLG